MNVNETMFWTSFYTFTGGCILACFDLLYKSKCKKVKLCGLEIDRDVETEMIEDMSQMNKNTNETTLCFNFHMIYHFYDIWIFEYF
jgi:hypothetical protein